MKHAFTVPSHACSLVSLKHLQFQHHETKQNEERQRGEGLRYYPACRMRQGSVTVCCCASFHSVSSPGRCSKFSLGHATRFGHSVITGLTLEGPQSWNLLFSIWKKKKKKKKATITILFPEVSQSIIVAVWIWGRNRGWSWHFAVLWVFLLLESSCTQRWHFVGSPSQASWAGSQVLVLSVIFVRRLHPLIISYFSPKQLIKWRQKA